MVETRLFRNSSLVSLEEEALDYGGWRRSGGLQFDPLPTLKPLTSGRTSLTTRDSSIDTVDGILYVLGGGRGGARHDGGSGDGSGIPQ